MNLVVALRAAVTCDPVVASAPLQPPEALHAVALVDDQVNVEVAPLFTLVGLAAKVTAGAGLLTETVADCAALPPVPLQVSVYVWLALSAPVDCEPLTALVPDQAPDAEHVVALVADQLNVELLPLATVLGLAASVTVGAEEDAFTETVADCAALPPDPEHVRVNVELALRAPVDCEPLNALPPDHAPEAVQVPAWLDDHVSVED